MWEAGAENSYSCKTYTLASEYYMCSKTLNVQYVMDQTVADTA